MSKAGVESASGSSVTEKAPVAAAAVVETFCSVLPESERRSATLMASPGAA